MNNDSNDNYGVLDLSTTTINQIKMDRRSLKPEIKIPSNKTCFITNVIVQSKIGEGNFGKTNHYVIFLQFRR